MQLGHRLSALLQLIFILNLTPGFNGLGKDNCKTREESFQFCDLVRSILEILRCVVLCLSIKISNLTYNLIIHEMCFAL